MNDLLHLSTEWISLRGQTLLALNHALAARNKQLAARLRRRLIALRHAEKEASRG